jgi:AraC-like DNA-binding protein
MAFRYKGEVSYVANNTKNNLPFSMVSGLRKSRRLINYSNDTGNILVIFKETGANAFLKEPLHELFDDSISLENITGYQNLSIIEERLAGAVNNRQRIDLIEQFLISKLYDHKPDKLILNALERVHSAKGIIKIKDLANSLYISQDAFEKRFRRIVGVSPKQFSFIVRMKSVVNGGLNKQTLAESALDAGYFDQSHFNKDFKLFTGQTPTDFLKSPVFW